MARWFLVCNLCTLTQAFPSYVIFFVLVCIAARGVYELPAVLWCVEAPIKTANVVVNVTSGCGFTIPHRAPVHSVLFGCLCVGESCF